MMNTCEICNQAKASVLLLPWKKSMMVVCQQQCLVSLLKGAKVPVRSPPSGRFMAMDENRRLVEFRKVSPATAPQKPPSQWITAEEDDRISAMDEKKRVNDETLKKSRGVKKQEPVEA